MFIIGNLLQTIAYILNMVLSLFMFLIIGRAIISWVSPDPSNPIVQFLHSATDPVLYHARRLLPFPTSYSGIDFSPIVVLIAIVFLQSFLVQSLTNIAMRLQ